MIGAATSLSAYGSAMPETDRLELLDSIRSEGERLDRYIQNLLDMTRLGSGGLTLERDWIDTEEVLNSAVARVRRLFLAVEFETRIARDLPLLYVHPALIEQALFNILENAARFSPAGAPVVATAERPATRSSSTSPTAAREFPRRSGGGSSTCSTAPNAAIAAGAARASA